MVFRFTGINIMLEKEHWAGEAKDWSEAGNHVVSENDQIELVAFQEILQMMLDCRGHQDERRCRRGAKETGRLPARTAPERAGDPNLAGMNL